MNLSEQQITFCEEYLIDHDATAAAERAGYSKSTAKKWSERLMGNVLISERIDELLHEKDEVCNKSFIIDHLKEIVRRCMQAKPVLKKNAGKKEPEAVMNENGCMVYEFDAASAFKALELLGKHMGMFADKTRSAEREHRGYDIIIEGIDPQSVPNL